MTDNSVQVAIIEDSEDLREELMFFLRSRHHSVWGVNSAEQFWKELHRHPVDIVVVDIGLPGEDGFSVLDYLRSLGDFGLVVATARGSQQDRLRALNLGADHYLVKPINFAELARLIEGLWQRIRAQKQLDESPQARVTDGQGWKLAADVLIAPEGRPLSLTPQEQNLLEILLRNASQICSKELLHDMLFGHEAEQDLHRIDVILSRLRTKAREQGVKLPIRSVFGKGLVFVQDLG